MDYKYLDFDETLNKTKILFLQHELQLIINFSSQQLKKTSTNIIFIKKRLSTKINAK
jgi:hypothetical protein